jgi:hypothetical protein
MQVYDDVIWFVDHWCVPLSSIAEQALNIQVEELDLPAPPLADSSPEVDEKGGRGGGGAAAACAGVVERKRSFFLAHCLFAELAPALLSVGGRRVTQYLDTAFCHKYIATMSFLKEVCSLKLLMHEALSYYSTGPSATKRLEKRHCRFGSWS